MKIEFLRNYRGLLSNIEAIERQIQTMYNSVSSPNVKPSIGAGWSGEHPGNPTERTAFQIIDLKEELEQRKAEQETALVEIENWLKTIPNIEMESIIRWHFLLGQTWAVTNEHVYGYADKEYSRKQFQRFRSSNPGYFE